jgi:uncharacterized repeat protein (TIGR03806 family)
MGIVVTAGLVASCAKSAASPCAPGAAGADTGDFAPSVSAYCMVTVENGAVVPKAGVTPYDLNTPLFSDYAVKYRTVWLPPGTSVPYAADGRFELPVGSVVTKSFGFPADFRVPVSPAAPVKWVETRVLVRGADGWKGSSYLWNDGQTEADVSPGGGIATPTFIDARGNAQTPTYLVPSQAECKKCHANDGAMVTLGPSAAQLNRDFAYPSGDTENELAHWARVGLLTGAPSPDQAPKLPVFDDPSTGTVEARARAYLQTNCSYCHNGNGEARTSGLVLLASETDPYALGFCKPPVAAGKAGKDQRYDIVPGHPEESILVTRMASTEPSIAMPELGRSLEHVEAVQVVSDWITGADGGCP